MQFLASVVLSSLVRPSYLLELLLSRISSQWQPQMLQRLVDLPAHGDPREDPLSSYSAVSYYTLLFPPQDLSMTSTLGEKKCYLGAPVNLYLLRWEVFHVLGIIHMCD